ncbi:hypothetical protein [Devosia sp. LjRoot3]|uniref:hypothetical protein n=1 Tax=Devosia sp. LjRoot3 TaxID=3342319 RepID=UPI003ED0643E
MRAAQTDSNLVQRYPGFHSWKSVSPVHYPRRWQRAVLVQAALDPTITAIAPLPVAIDELHAYSVDFGFVVTISQTDFALLVTETRLVPDIAGLELPGLTICRSSILKEPAYSTANMIWSKKRLVVDPMTRYVALEAVQKSAEGSTLSTLLQALQFPLPQSLEAVLAMLAQGILVADVSRGLISTTRIRAGDDYREIRNVRPWERLRRVLSSS